MSQSKQTIEELTTLSAWVTSGIVLLNLLSVFIVFSIATVESLALIIFVSGTVGGAASNYRRLQKAYAQELRNNTLEPASPPLHAPVPDLKVEQLADTSVAKESSAQALKHAPGIRDSEEPIVPNDSTLLVLKLQIFLSPLFGGLFAFVLYGVFAAGLIQGSIFPAFNGTQDDYETPHDFAAKTLPATNQDAAKAILWAFVAGFAEGVVPNFIDKLIKDIQDSDRTR